MAKDYYEILEVHPKASEEIIRKAYLTLAKKYHPDANKGNENWATQKMKDLNEAFEVLGNLDKRHEYDKNHYGYGTSQSNSANHSESTNSSNTSQQTEQQRTHNELVFLCQQIIDELTQKIVKEDYAIATNLSLCKNAENKFQSQVVPLVQKIQRFITQSPEIFIDAMDYCSLTLYIMGVSYTWAMSFVKAEETLQKALTYRPSNELESNIRTTLSNVKKNADLERKHVHLSQAEKQVLKNKFKKNVIWPAIGLFAFALLIIFANTVSSSNSTNKKYTSKSSTTSSYAKPASSPKSSFTPILNKPTGYDPQFNQKNNGGLSNLTIDNTRNDYPVYVKLYSLKAGNPTAVRAFYVQKGGSFTLDNITAGLYDVRYRNLQTGNLSKTEQFNLTEIKTATGTNYSDVRFTLYTVANGNTRMSKIGEDQFK